MFKVLINLLLWLVFSYTAFIFVNKYLQYDTIIAVSDLFDESDRKLPAIIFCFENRDFTHDKNIYQVSRALADKSFISKIATKPIDDYVTESKQLTEQMLNHSITFFNGRRHCIAFNTLASIFCNTFYFDC